jgi:hypothetical protein
VRLDHLLSRELLLRIGCFEQSVGSHGLPGRCSRSLVLHYFFNASIFLYLFWSSFSSTGFLEENPLLHSPLVEVARFFSQRSERTSRTAFFVPRTKCGFRKSWGAVFTSYGLGKIGARLSRSADGPSGRGRTWGGPRHHVSPTRGPSARRPSGPGPLLENICTSPVGG